MSSIESSSTRADSRQVWDAAFDIVKGALVVWMVVRHTVIIASTAEAGFFARYINFLSGSFIFVMGYMIGRFAQRKFNADPGLSSRRLVSRGMKILLIFTALNFLIQAGGFGNAGKERLGIAEFLARLDDIFTGDIRIVSFLILLPIGYVLVLAPVMLAVSRGRRWMAGLVLAASLLAGILPVLPQDSLVFRFMVVGIAAVAIGQLVSPAQTGLSAPLRWPAAAALLATGIWIAGPLGINSSAYAIGVALVLLSLYWLASAMDSRHTTARWLALLGRYSLVGYILQILLIQVLLRALGGQRLPPGPELAVIGVATLLAVFATCLLLEWMRSRSRGIDGAYRFVFS